MLYDLPASAMLYSSTETPQEDVTEAADSNTYQPFRSVDAGVMNSIAVHMSEIDDKETEGVYL
jgi:transcription initiation factor TFIIH subunit 3